jgi:hypothetical protein
MQYNRDSNRKHTVCVDCLPLPYDKQTPVNHHLANPQSLQVFLPQLLTPINSFLLDIPLHNQRTHPHRIAPS